VVASSSPSGLYTSVPFNLNVSVPGALGGAEAQVLYSGTVVSGSASASATTDDYCGELFDEGTYPEGNATLASSSGYVLTSTTLAAGTPVSLTAVFNRSGTLRAGPLCGKGQEFFDIDLDSNNTNASLELHQQVYAGSSAWLADSNVFSFGLSGNSPIALSGPTITVTTSDQASISVGLGPLDRQLSDARGPAILNWCV
jgi:hypothetical protein